MAYKMKRKDYEERVKQPIGWGHHAWALRTAARVVRALAVEKEKAFLDSGKTNARLQSDFHLLAFVDSMLHGMAVEAALKGHIIATAPGKVTFDVKKDGAGREICVRLEQVGVPVRQSHDLNALVKAALKSGLNLALLETPETKRILEFLGRCVRWAGRYPVPLKNIEIGADGQIIPDSKDGSRGIPRKDVDDLLDALIGHKFDGHTFPDPDWP